MSQGLANAPATFQRLMDNAFRSFKTSCVLVYLDNINVFSKTFDDHLIHLEQVFKWFLDNNLKLKPCKCSFFKSELKYLEFVINQKGLHPQAAKIEAIEKMKVPTSVCNIQVFLGMVGYYQRFTKDFAKRATVLFNLLHKDIMFN